MNRRKKLRSSGTVLTSISKGEDGFIRAKAYLHGVPDREGEPHQLIALCIYLPSADSQAGLRALLLATQNQLAANGGAP